jgi:predicted ATPase/DNA-binding CsgD family transcriptional regulator
VDTPIRPGRGIPADLTSFVGRRRELAEIRRLLESSRLLTLTGAGGIGKTRLALHTARARRRAFADGAWVIELGMLSDSSLLPQAVSAALGVPDASNTSRMEALLDFLADREALLILDNCEHLVDECAHLVRTLLRNAEGIRVIATSRQALGIEGEQVFGVPPLTLPDRDAGQQTPETLLQYESVGLFVDRARSVVPSFQLDQVTSEHVVRLCRDLEGVPLAIELAAVRLRSLSVADIVARLDDRFRLLTAGHRASADRQTSLTAMVEWSYDLLDEADRALWARLSSFAGGFDLAAAEAVCSDDALPSESLLARLHSLVERSIVIREDDGARSRYRMLETLRQYGECQLRDAGEQEKWQARHRDWCRALAAEAADGWAGSEQLAWSRRLTAERHNIRAAISYSLRTPADAVVGLHLAVDLRYFWLVHAVSEGRRHVERLLAALPRGADAEAAKVRGQWLAGWLAFYQGDIAAARRHVQESAALADRLGDDMSRGYAGYVAGLVAECDHDYQLARNLLSKARDVHGRTEDRVGGWLATADLAGVLGLLGHLDEGVEITDRAVGQTAERGARWCQSYLLWILADLRRMQNQHTEAARLLKTIIDINRDFDDPVVIGAALESLSWVASQRADPKSAAWLLGAAHSTWGNAGISLLQFAEWGQEHQRAVDRVRNVLGEQEFSHQHRLGAQASPSAAFDRVLGAEPAARGDTTRQAAPARIEDLTPRELEIVELISEGLTNKKIAQRLVIAQRTAEGHVERILRKLNCDSRTQVAAWWMSRAPR